MSRKEAEEITKHSERLHLGRCSFDLRTGELSGPDGATIRLRPQSAGILSLLAAEPGKVVSKHDLMDAVWKDTHVTEDSLVQCVTDIRRAVGPEGRDMIETVPKKGYRLKPTAHRDTKNTRFVVIAGFTLLSALFALAVWFWPIGGGDRGSDRKGVVVLPFLNMSSDPEQEYFSDGITVDLITDLSKVSGLLVVAQSSAFTFKGSDAPVREVAARLGVDYVVEGSVRKDGERIRINTQLVDAETGNQMWADRYDRSLTDVFSLQDEVVKEIVSALSVTLKASEIARLSEAANVDSEAYDLLLRGLASYRRFTISDNRAARGYFERALEIDPGFARAYADLALTHVWEIQLDWVRDAKVSAETAMTLARKAQLLDPQNPYVHFALSIIHRTMGRHEESLAAARKAIEIDPNYADGHALLAIDLNYAGRPEEGMLTIEKALRLNPQAPFFYFWIRGQAHYLLGRYKEAATDLERAKFQNPEFIPVHKLLAAARVELGQTEEAEWEVAEIEVRLPEFSLRQERASSPYSDDAVFDRYIQNLRKAGLK
ncbi:winged helix-turn-helix domain-containing tetratricopeptide repeat protein [Aurantimonas coralicida]|uniref:winged helix-turn-helix domain-containing tetratricopeptide repeat protein n=1 Tax=Aurantimonas coralicida TaxID=182270 RepID=UPI001E5E56AB|nr:tetratricopeptide repeat protein [Aurantimonas coralicida]MCD1644504.1 tetratricopeptide repeat protein [Aurantimonas coralicida]|tara:strand:+ start:835 stop:2466 length:1632 start_codon:yes stop_codon:yes gene_type:complete